MPVDVRDLDNPRVGNRFDSPTGDYGVCYFGSNLEACYGETLARFRPDPLLEQYFDHDDSMGFGQLPADWRDRRTAVHVKLKPTPERPYIRFVDVQAAESLRQLERALAPLLAVYNYPELSLPVVAGRDRRITRWIGKFVHLQRDAHDVPLYAGIRYRSQLGADWDCWAVFGGVDIERISNDPIAIEDPIFQKVAKQYRLKAY